MYDLFFNHLTDHGAVYDVAADDSHFDHNMVTHEPLHHHHHHDCLDQFHHDCVDVTGTQYHDGYQDGFEDGQMYGLGAHYGSIDVYQNGVMLAVALSLSGALDLVRRGKARVLSDRSIEVLR